MLIQIHDSWPQSGRGSRVRHECESCCALKKVWSWSLDAGCKIRKESVRGLVRYGVELEDSKTIPGSKSALRPRAVCGGCWKKALKEGAEHLYTNLV